MMNKLCLTCHITSYDAIVHFFSDMVMAIIPHALLWQLPWWPLPLAFLLPPELPFLHELNYCMSFSFYIRSALAVVLTDDSKIILLWDTYFSRGKAWHQMSLDIPQGDHSIYIIGIFSKYSFPVAFQWAQKPPDIYSHMIDNITFTPGNCSSHRG